ncbi:family 20 glycosylhydrolase [Pedobacter nyackensis]|uniref:family 20 glycosylhydrolase n=1 Tax=Pedobacter nyackensis TaxID=475255 RepID=UPI00292EAA60|nr:family 20 glycosylhydrolase [Pedobacter nyackensis]
MKKLLFFCLLLKGLTFAVYAQSAKFDTGKLQVEWQLLENNYQGKSQFLAAFTITNNSSVSLNLGELKMYFSYPRTFVKTFAENIRFENVSGEFCRIVPLSRSAIIPPTASLIIKYIAEGKSKNYTDAPSGLYFVHNSDEHKALQRPHFKVKHIPAQERDNLKLNPAVIYEKNELTKVIADDQLQPILPSPVAYRAGKGSFELDNEVFLVYDVFFGAEAELLNETFKKILGEKLTIKVNSKVPSRRLILKKVEGLAEEGYTLSIKQEGIVIGASTKAGVFYGIQSLKMMFPVSVWKMPVSSVTVPFAEVQDQPRFSYRSFMLDVARNFQTKKEIFKLIDLLALYKLNTLHFHFSDDEGWRLEIPSLPELTTVGAKRGHTIDENNHLRPAYGSGPDPEAGSGSGFYSRLDFIEILKYANARHIKVIPEIETPGHARAAIKAMDARYRRLMKLGRPEEARRYLLRDTLDHSVYRSVQGYKDNVMNIALPSTYAFIEQVIDEIRAMYREAGSPLNTIHMGGDEVPVGVWQLSPAINRLMKEQPAIKDFDALWYFYLDKVSKMLDSRGLYLSGWEEVGMRKTKLDGNSRYIPNPDFLNRNFHTYVWNNVWGWGAEDLAYRLANSGYKVVLSPVTNFYFDLAYEQDADEPGLYWSSFLDVDKPFYFSPFDYYRTAKEMPDGSPVDKDIFKGKERLTEFGQSNIVGLQSQIWSEKIHGANELEYMLLPKLLGFAERAWAARSDWDIESDSVKSDFMYQKAWSNFANLLGNRELPRMDHYSGGFNYRIPAVGAKVEAGRVKANLQLPGFTIRYTTDGTEPDLNSRIYTSPISEKGTIVFRAFNSMGRGGRSISIKHF